MTRGKKSQAEQPGILPDQEIRRLASIAFADPAEAFDPAGVLLPRDQMPEGVRRAIASVETAPVYERRGSGARIIGFRRVVQFENKVEALIALGERLGLFPDSMQIDCGPVLEGLVSAGDTKERPARRDENRKGEKS